MIHLVLTFLVLLGIGFGIKYHFSNRNKKIVQKVKSPTIKVEKIKYEETTLEQLLKRIPLFSFYPNESIENITKTWPRVIYKNREKIATPCFVVSGEVEIYFKDRLICTKKRGSIACGALELLGEKIIPTRIAKGEVEVILIEKQQEITKKLSYILFSMIGKSCIEIISKYFELHAYILNMEELKLVNLKNFKDEFVSLLVQRLKLNGTNKDGLLDEIYTSTFKKGQIIKEKGEMLDCIFCIEEGKVVVETDTTVHEYGKGSIFGYMAIFFDVYSSVKIYVKETTKIYSCRTNVLNKVGVDENSFDYSSLKSMGDLINFIDLGCEWVRVLPGNTLIYAGEPVNDVLYIYSGCLKTVGEKYYSGVALGDKESIIGECWKNTISAVKITDTIRIPFSVINLIFEFDSSFFKKYTERLFLKNKDECGKIVTIVPSGNYKELISFSKRLKAAIDLPCLTLSRKDVVDVLAKKAFGTTEELRFMDSLTKMARKHSIVLISIENGYSRLLKYLLNFSDVLLIVGTSLEDIPEYNAYCSVELVKIYEERRAENSSNVSILNKIRKRNRNKNKWKGKRREPDELIYDRLHHVLSPSKTILFCSKDFQRLGRSLLGKRIGLVLSGGGARGLAHIGVIQALEEEGVPIDCVGGTSMGAFVGGLYARECNNYYAFHEAKSFSSKMASLWWVAFDLTYPICSMFSGNIFNNALKGIFKDELIQNLWIEYFCVSLDLLSYEEKVHRSGILWRFIRASMGLCGYLPPVCHEKSLLVDGGYLNNVPADIMLKMQVERVITVDVGSVSDTDYHDYGDSLSGFTVLFNKFFGNKKFMTMEEIQYRLAFMTTEMKVKMIENNPRVIIIRPDLGPYKNMDFKRFDEIVSCGYTYTKNLIAEWKKDGTFNKYFTKGSKPRIRRRHSV